MTAFTDSRHEFHRAFLNRWRFYLDSYEGGQDYLEAGYLFRHFRENELDYRDRLMRSYYYNFCKTVVDAYIAQIFHQSNGIFRDDGGTRDYARFLSDIDGKGSDIQSFMREQVAPAAQIFGHVHVLVDRPVMDRQPVSRAEENALSIRPYCAVIYPESLVDFRLDGNGGFLWARILESGPDAADPFDIEDNGTRSRYRTWTADAWFLHDADGELISSGEHRLGRVPLITVFNVESRKYLRFGVSALGDIAPINRSIYNWCSLNDEFLYRQCFNILAIPQSPGGKVRKIGTTSALTFPYDAAKTPFYLYPPVEPGKYLLENINDAIEQIYRIAVLGMNEIRSARQVESELSKAYDFHRANQHMLKKARNLEKAEVEIGVIWGLWENRPGFSPTVEYPREFNIVSLAEQLKTDFELIQADISDTFTKTLKKRVVSRALKLDDAAYNRIFAEIDAGAGSPPDRETAVTT